ncbi:MAG TPA: alpha/beta hydrolase fold domain-containing protein [Acidimicrobiales bacterium]|nr:alpha/beta hydrolase fold domain-containing protein [Acidimicrobiales bacterium]
MGNRPEVKTAPAPVVALDVALLAQQMTVALARLPWRRPFAGDSTRLSNFGASVTREVIRSFMGYASSLRIPEFRSLELFLDEICRFIMPPVVATLEVETHTTELGGVPGILYLPKRNPPVAVILYLHGGGYIGTSPTMYAFFTARVCRTTDCAVFVADYRLAPEFPFPAGAEDASAVYAELRALGVPAERIFLGGDSGGGGLANTLLLACPRHVDPVHPAGLLLFSPEVDLRLDEPSVTENADRDILPWNIPTTSYLHGVDATEDPVSPLTADLSGFPPTCVTWGGNEMFRDPIRRYVRRLRDAGVPTEAHEFEGMFHVFQILMPWAEDSRDVFQQVRDFVHELVVDTPPLTLGYLRQKLGFAR